MIAITGPRIAQARLLIIIACLILGTFILSGLWSIAHSRDLAQREIDQCQEIDRQFVTSHYYIDEADGICKRERTDDVN